ncbi:uncharacterized membrane protein HdeD (DUF308 family) [Marmoricola sp. OAE513]|uniref:hypothetical protein n=1 Tax=Marmoricola sp. OAE513 TaxID=2817894 RepID=UPI001AEAEA05
MTLSQKPALVAGATAADSTSAVVPLRRLYLLRFGFALVWAGLFAWAFSPYETLGLVLAVAYPTFDVVAALVDHRASSEDPVVRSRLALGANVAISAAAAVGLLLVGSGDLGGALRVWGAWAIAAGVVQLAVGLRRRSVDGHVPMILSGGISVLAGASFLATAGDASSLGMLAGYATLGGIFFLVSAVRLGRSRSAHAG